MIRIAIAAGLTALACSSPALATFPGTNGAIAFERDGDIWSIDPDGSHERQLTSGSPVDAAPEWSADGSELMFTRNGNGAYTIHADGTGLTLVQAGGNPQFSREGTRIASYEGSGVTVAARDGSGAKKITAEDEFTPRDWSPTSDLVLWTQFNNLSWVGADSTSGAHVAFTMPGDYRWQSPQFSPDGRWIVMAVSLAPENVCFDVPECRVDPETGTVVMSMDGTRNTIRPGVSFYPTWSPDGSLIAYGAEFGKISLMNADGTGTHALTSGTEPDWQPGPLRVTVPEKPQILTVAVPVPGSERVVTRTVQGAAPACVIPPGRPFALTLRATKAIRKGAVLRIRVSDKGKGTVLNAKRAGIRVSR